MYIPIDCYVYVFYILSQILLLTNTHSHKLIRLDYINNFIIF